MKKVLYIITKSNWGGAQRYVFDLATNLPKSEYRIAVAFGQPGLLAEKLNASGVETHALGSMQRDVALLKDIRSFIELYRLLKKERPDVVHLNSSKAGAIGALAARLAGVPKIIFTAHGLPFREKRNFIWRAFAYVGTWVTMLLSTRVICVSEYDLRQARKMPLVGHKTVRIYNGIDLATPLGSGEIIRRAFPADAKITGTIGELNKNKNQITLIEEARKNSSMYAAIIGEGELRGYLESKIKEYDLENRVKLFGFIPAAEALRGFDAFALPSLKEGLPYVLLEARVAGLPIVANPVGGIPEILSKDLKEFSLERMVEQTKAFY